jgi:hypothetical protein
MSKSYKRPAYNANSNWKNAQQQQWNKLNPGQCGLFFTAEDEKRAFREAVNLIENVLAEDGEETNKVLRNEEGFKLKLMICRKKTQNA